MSILTPAFRKLAVGAAAATLLLTGCGSADGSTKADVVATVYPYAYVAQQILGSHGKVLDLSANAGDAHDVELSPKQVAAIKDAQLVVHQTGFQAPVDETVKQNQPKREIDVAKLVDFIELDDHSHGRGEADHKDDSHGHQHEGKDPHVWLDIEQLRKLGPELVKQLSAIYPQYKADFEKNAAALDQKLVKLDSDMKSGLSSCQIDHVIVNHAAFGYLGNRYGFHQVGISGLEPEVEPSPAQIKAAAEAAQQYGVTTIFYETGVSDKVAKSIARDLKLKVAVLNPLESLGKADAGKDYESIMRDNLNHLREANRCK